MQQTLMRWFTAEKRDLPWRHDLDPYRVWVSEIMLQQTQVAVVITYFNRWMRLFPTMHHLAAASLESVIKAWEGLGYYSRARNMHALARYLVEHCQGKFPTNYTDLVALKGIGPYTAGAICSFAFHQRCTAIDGNVIRVLARYFNIEEDITQSTTLRKIGQLAESLLPEETPWIFNEALIELGATLCSKQPKCAQCPVQSSCAAYHHGTPALLPFKSKKTIYEKLERDVFVIKCAGQVLLQRGEQGKIMSDLYEFPYLVKQKALPLEQVLKNIEQQWGIAAHHESTLQPVSHTFTRFRVQLFPLLLSTKFCVPVPGFLWCPQDSLPQLPFSSGHRRVLAQLL